jgi:hypothetical protein
MASITDPDAFFGKNLIVYPPRRPPMTDPTPTTMTPPEGLTDEQLLKLASSHWIAIAPYDYDRTRVVVEIPGSGLLAFARAVLARWGGAAVKPVPVSERLPGPEDCCVNPRNGQGQWCWGWVQHDPVLYSGRWRMMPREWLTDEALAWAPWWAFPVPAADKGEVAA